MAQFKRIKREVSGVLLLDKPLGVSSNQALQQIKRIYQAAKAGHTGSLDPLATGLLPICFGEATKFSHFLLDADKSYRALIRLGATTTTADAEGAVIATHAVNVSIDEVQTTLKHFTGEIKQVPPMYSALKHEGKALYEYARAGVELVRDARDVTIFDIQFHGLANDLLDVTVVCSKGTYIRTLAEDIGVALGCGAHLAGLRRLTTAHYDLVQAFTVDDLERMSPEQRDAALLPSDSAIQNLPEVVIDEDSAFYLMRGQEVWKQGLNPQGLFRIYSERGVFLGIGEQTATGRIAPKRLIVHKTTSS
jgi:tRNA pseudouridine55 synthase